MKLALLLAMLATSSAWAAVPPDCDLTKLLAAIAAKEGQAQDAIGPHGERSIYGITKHVWDDHMNTKDEYAMGFELCTTRPFLARQVAIAHLNWLSNEVAKASYPPNCYVLAACWHLGLRGYIEAARAGREIPYAKDVQNLYQSDSASKIATISPP